MIKREQLIEKGFTEEQVTELLNMFHDTNNQNQTLLNQISNLKQFETKYNDVQKQLDEINKSKMTEQEQIDANKKAAEEYLSKSKRIYNTAKAKEILAGYDIEEDLISTLVDDDENSTIAKANLFKNRLETLKESTLKKAKEDLTSIDVKPNPTNVPQGDDIMTKEKFDKLTMSEQKQFKDANIDLYHEWYPQN